MNDRDELAKVIVTAYGEDAEVECPCEQDLDLADAILAAGWVKPRTITTVEELATVHAGAILLDAIGEQWGVYGGEDRLFLVADGWEETYDDDDIPLPAIIVHEGQA